MANNNTEKIASIDRLFSNIGKYRSSSRFKEMLKFYSRFHYLGAYNAALVEQQRPGAEFVATADAWRKRYQRKIKLDARPVIILLPFYPVDFLFDISDTEPIQNATKYRKDVDILDEISNQFKAETEINSRSYFQRLEENLPKYGIHIQPFITGANLGAKLEKVDKDNQVRIKIDINKDLSTWYHNYYTISIDSNADEPTKLASAFHELGHLFCHHQTSPGKWWEVRNLEHNAKEFEAEIVSYLVCERMGIRTHSEQYLAGYVNDDEPIPDISIEKVCSAVDEIEKMIKSRCRVEDCLLYKNDDEFKKTIKELRATEKARKEALKNRL